MDDRGEYGLLTILLPPAELITCLFVQVDLGPTVVDLRLFLTFKPSRDLERIDIHFNWVGGPEGRPDAAVVARGVRTFLNRHLPAITHRSVDLALLDHFIVSFS